MRLTVIGCSGSFAGPASPASCYLIQADDGGRVWSILVDLGNGALGALQRHWDPADLDAVFLTHLHPDHCADLCGLYVLRKYRPGGPMTTPLPVFGPTGTFDQLVRMYYGSKANQVAKHFRVTEVAHAEPVAVGSLTVTPYAVRHPVEAYGYRVSDGASTVAFSGDTDSCDNLSPLLTGADLALMDSAFVEGRDAERGIHLTGARAAQAALAAGGVRRLMLTHIPVWNDPQVCRAQAADVWPGAVELAEPGATYPI